MEEQVKPGQYQTTESGLCVWFQLYSLVMKTIGFLNINFYRSHFIHWKSKKKKKKLVTWIWFHFFSYITWQLRVIFLIGLYSESWIPFTICCGLKCIAWVFALSLDDAITKDWKSLSIIVSFTFNILDFILFCDVNAQTFKNRWV